MAPTTSGHDSGVDWHSGHFCEVYSHFWFHASNCAGVLGEQAAPQEGESVRVGGYGARAYSYAAVSTCVRYIRFDQLAASMGVAVLYKDAEVDMARVRNAIEARDAKMRDMHNGAVQYCRSTTAALNEGARVTWNFGQYMTQ